MLAAACLYDADSRCDANQHLGAGEACVCDEGYAFRGQACEPCGENETYEGGACVCAEGYTRGSGAESACIESNAGTRCDPAESNSCQDETFGICRDRGADVGYCTKACEADEDCPHGYACDTSAAPATCMSSPVGQGQACESSEDCEGTDATYCETTLAGACLVQGCSTDNPLSCSEGFGCCDLASLGLELTLCVPEGMCPTAG